MRQERMDADTLKRGPRLRSQPSLAPHAMAQRSAKVSSLLSSMSQVSPSLPPSLHPSLPACLPLASPHIPCPFAAQARTQHLRKHMQEPSCETRLVSDESTRCGGVQSWRGSRGSRIWRGDTTRAPLVHHLPARQRLSGLLREAEELHLQYPDVAQTTALMEQALEASR